MILILKKRSNQNWRSLIQLSISKVMQRSNMYMYVIMNNEEYFEGIDLDKIGESFQ